MPGAPLRRRMVWQALERHHAEIADRHLRVLATERELLRRPSQHPYSGVGPDPRPIAHDHPERQRGIIAQRSQSRRPANRDCS